MSVTNRAGRRQGKPVPGWAARVVRDVDHVAEPFDWRDLIGSPELIYPESARAAVVSIDEAVSRCGSNVVLYCRVSSAKQSRTIPGQRADLLAAARRAGLTIVGRVTEVGNASLPRRPRLKRAIELARQRNAFVLAHNPSRYLRHPAFGPSNFELQPFGHSWVVLAGIANDVTLATITEPEATNREIRSAESVRGQSTSKRRGGRPPKPVQWKKGARGTDDEWRAILSTFKGQNVRAFCSQFGVSTRTYYGKRRKLGM